MVSVQAVNLFNVLTLYFNYMQAQVSLRRLCRYLCCPETESSWTSRVFGSVDEENIISSTSDMLDLNKSTYCGDHGQHPDEDVHGQAITVQDADFTWSCDNDSSITLNDVSLSIPEGSLVVILGKVTHHTSLYAFSSIYLEKIWLRDVKKLRHC